MSPTEPASSAEPTSSAEPASSLGSAVAGFGPAPSAPSGQAARTGRHPGVLPDQLGAPEAPQRRGGGERLKRLRAGAATEPGRLRAIGAVLAALVVTFGALTAWEVSQRAAAADAVRERSQPLSADAARIYRSLADANASVASEFLAGGGEPRHLRKRYEKRIAEASALLTKAARQSESSPASQRQIARLNRQLPVYTGLVESARANNRQGLPLGGAYLRYADDRMREELLPAAERLYAAEIAQLDADRQEAGSWPLLALGSGVLALAALGWAQRRDRLRTNRLLNPGLLGATAASLVLLVWLASGHTVARVQLERSHSGGARSLEALTAAWTGALQARGDENMTLVTRGAGEEYERSFRARMAEVAGGGPGRSGAGHLADALALADDAEGERPVRAARRAVHQWRERHAEARELEEAGAYQRAVDKVTGERNSTGASFDRVAAGLERATAHEQREFERAAGDGRGAFAGLPSGAVALAALGAAAALLGVARRLAEYR